MVLRKLTQKDVPAAQALWMEAFGDSKEFIRFYFENKFKLKNSMGAFINGALVGDITMQEANVRMRGSLVKTGFLAGCATKKDYRYHGIMQNLLCAQLKDMNRRGYALCHLHPFLHAFYRKFGWETVSYMRRSVIAPQKAGMPARENVFDLERLYLLYRNFTGKLDGYFERSPKDMAVRVREHLNDGGKIISSGYGYAMYFVSADAVDVIELVWSQKPVLNELLSMLSAYQKKIIYAVPDYAGRGGAIEEYTMMRVVNAKKLFESILLPGCNFTVSVRDDFCAWNNVRLQVAYPGGGAQVNETAGGAGGAEVNIRDLSRLVSGKKTGSKGILSEAFPGQKTCFFNTY